MAKKLGVLQAWVCHNAGEPLSTLVERLPDLSKFPAKIHYHRGSWTWYMISRVISALKYSILTVHDHWEQQNEPSQLSWTYLMYLASWGSNYTWIWMYLLDQFAENFVHLWHHALAGAYKPLHGAQKFLVMVLWDYVPCSSYFSASSPSLNNSYSIQ